MKKRPAITVFCGSNDGSLHYAEAADVLGTALIEVGADLVYGAGDRGLMGRVAISVQAGGGYVVGVNPHRFHATGKHRLENDEYIVVKTLQKRKEIMISRADAFIALPGGIGTLDEIMEVYSLKQLGLCDKPIGLLNIDGFFDQLLSFFDFIVSKGFMKRHELDYLIIKDDPRELVAAIMNILRFSDNRDEGR